MMMTPELQPVRIHRREAIAQATGSARRVLVLIEHLVATSTCPIERRELRLQAVKIRRTLIAILRAPSPFDPHEAIRDDIPMTPLDGPLVPRRTVTHPQHPGAP